MLYFDNLDDIKLNNGTVVTLGKFDGVHKGHQKLLREAHCIAKEYSFEVCVFTFDTPPKAAIDGEKAVSIFDKNEKRHIIARFGTDIMIECPFTKEIRSMEPEDFVKDVLIDRLNCKALVVGDDFCFGKDRKGTPDFLLLMGEKYGLKVEVMHKYLDKNKEISSTYVREMLVKGDIEKTNELLGFPYFAEGEVVHGARNGRKMGFPTVNLIPDEGKILPPNGVYATAIEIDQVIYKSITNIGCRPTVSGEKISIETNIPGFKGDLYGRFIKVDFYSFVRPERKFGSLDELKMQIAKDLKTIGF